MSILKLHAKNLDVDRQKTPYSELSVGVAATATSSTVLNTTGFKTGYWLLFGEMNGESSEMVVLNSISGNVLSHDALQFAHDASTPVYCINYNQIKFYRLRANVESLVAAETMQVGGSKYTTTFYGEAQVGDEFATSFYNSETGAETQKSDWVNMNGYADNSRLGMMINAAALFKDKNNKVISDTSWYTWQAEAIGRLARKAQDKDEGYTLVGPIDITDITELTDYDGVKIALPDDFRTEKTIWVTYDGTNLVQAYPQNIQDGTPSDYYSKSSPRWAFDGDYIVVRPGGVQKARLRYYPSTASLQSDAEVPARPIRDFSYAIVNYMLMRAFSEAKDLDMATYYQKLWTEGVTEFENEVSKRQRDRSKQMVRPNPLFMLTRDGDSYI